ncbi:hypothetical protein [Kiloniella sp.]|uniref:hypothetical protein n=1 Tax=Kiloniella sp. TaxID=1938587 RepID=UPI003B01B700
MLIVIYLLYVKLSETIHINRLLGGRHLFLLNKAEKSQKSDPVFPRFQSPPPGGITAWYSMRLTAIGEDKEDVFNLNLETALKLYNERDEQRNSLWIQKFSSFYD